MVYMILNKKSLEHGVAEDYISLSTGTKYKPYDPTDSTQIKIKEEIDDFFFQDISK